MVPRKLRSGIKNSDGTLFSSFYLNTITSILSSSLAQFSLILLGPELG